MTMLRDELLRVLVLGAGLALLFREYSLDESKDVVAVAGTVYCAGRTTLIAGRHLVRWDLHIQVLIVIVCCALYRYWHFSKKDRKEWYRWTESHVGEEYATIAGMSVDALRDIFLGGCMAVTGAVMLQAVVWTATRVLWIPLAACRACRTVRRRRRLR
jgi:Ca2+/Na+ antiporter